MTQLRFKSLASLAPTLAGACLFAGCVLPSMPDADTDDGGTDSAGTGDGDGGSGNADSSGGIPGDCTPLTQEAVTGDTTLPAGCYAVSSLLVLSDRLDIEGGAELYFDSFAGITVGDGAVLSSVGTPDMPVLMTPSGDGWLGVRLQGAASSDNRLENTIVEGAAETGVSVGPTSRLTVASSEISGAGMVGMEADDGAEISVTGTTFAANALPLAVGIGAVAGIGTDNVFDGNDEQVVQVESGTLGSPAQWADAGVPYRFTGTVRIAGDLTVDPGVEVEMSQDSRWHVLDTGSMAAAGTAEAPVTFRGVQDERGYWVGISFESKTSSNVLSNCEVANGGGDGWNGSGDSVGMVWLEPESKATISDCLLRGSDGAAVATFGGADVSGFANNVIQGNRSTILIDPSMVDQLESSNTFVDNDEAFIRVGREHANNALIEGSATWLRHEIPYRVVERMFVDGAWTIEAGTELEVNQDTSILVRDTGSINAVGTADAHIVFRGVEALQGYWIGISIESLSASNVFDYVDISHGGSDGFNGSADSDGLVYIENASLLVSNSTFSDSGGYGVAVFADGALNGCTNVSFSGNAKADVYVHPNGATSACQ